MRIAENEGRLSKWRELYNELTPQDLAVLAAYGRIEPWGQERADLRAAVMAVHLMPGAKDLTKSEILAVARNMADYLSDDAQHVSPNQAVAMIGRIG